MSRPKFVQLLVVPDAAYACTFDLTHQVHGARSQYLIALDADGNVWEWDADHGVTRDNPQGEGYAWRKLSTVFKA